jgi:hypothetical protein
MNEHIGVPVFLVYGYLQRPSSLWSGRLLDNDAPEQKNVPQVTPLPFLKWLTPGKVICRTGRPEAAWAAAMLAQGCGSVISSSPASSMSTGRSSGQSPLKDEARPQ